MWFSVTLWTVLASLICSTVAHSSSHHSGFPDYDAAHKTGYTEDDRQRWNTALDDYEGRDPFSSSSAADAATLSRRIFDEKSADAAAAAALAHLESAAEDLPSQQQKRDSHSLSIVNPLDVLRQRLMLEMARRRMKENQEQIRENAVILKNLGKRASGDDDDRTKQDYLRRIHVSNSEDFDV